jgi:hypothetical protein
LTKHKEEASEGLLVKLSLTLSPSIERKRNEGSSPVRAGLSELCEREVKEGNPSESLSILYRRADVIQRPFSSVVNAVRLGIEEDLWLAVILGMAGFPPPSIRQGQFMPFFPPLLAPRDLNFGSYLAIHSPIISPK